MCGFAFFIDNTNNFNKTECINNMMDSIIHRGPDDSGYEVIDNMGFGFRRLSIIDLSTASHQPMWDKHNQFLIVFNGEIYNYLEIKKELIQLGHHFSSDGDAEVLLNAYIEWGNDCLQKLNGMFAFLIYNKENQKIFGARDRFGVKPLYIYKTNESIFIASEIKALFASHQIAKEVNSQIASDYLFYGTLEDTNHTFFTNISKIPAGYAFEINTKTIQYKQWQYWKLEQKEISSENYAEQYSQLFSNSINLRLRSDVPVGVFLSGGMDSTAIICEMKRQLDKSNNQQKLHAYSFISKQFDETNYIDQTVSQTQADIQYLSSNPMELWDEFDSALKVHDEPMLSITALVGFKLMKMAKNDGVKVILNGQGADEALAGYPTYFQNFWYSLLSSGKFTKLNNELDGFIKENGGNKQKTLVQLFTTFLKIKARRFQIYQQKAQKNQIHALQQDNWYTTEYKNQYQHLIKYQHDETLSDALSYSLNQYPLPLYLRIEDRNSMAHSVEARLPFMDYRLVELGYSLPDEEKMHHFWNKSILRNALKDKIPELVRTRKDKMGFPTPIDDWLRGDLYEPFSDIINSQSTANRGIFNLDTVKKQLEAHKNGNINAGGRLFRIVQFESWLKQNSI